MSPPSIDLLARLAATAGTRRQTLAALAAAISSIGSPGRTAAGPGCRNVGRACRRKGQCCSGVCRGGNTRTCKSHDTGGCKAGQPLTECGGSGGPAVSCALPDGGTGRCDTTTGNAGYCSFDTRCFPCQRDADCRPFCGPKAACIRCSTGICTDEGGTACSGPAACDFV